MFLLGAVVTHSALHNRAEMLAEQFFAAGVALL
jgi:hypothetical protein